LNEPFFFADPRINGPPYTDGVIGQGAWSRSGSDKTGRKSGVRQWLQKVDQRPSGPPLLRNGRVKRRSGWPGRSPNPLMRSGRLWRLTIHIYQDHRPPISQLGYSVAEPPPRGGALSTAAVYGPPQI